MRGCRELQNRFLALVIVVSCAWAVWQFGWRPDSIKNTSQPEASQHQNGNAQPYGILPFAPAAQSANRTAPASAGSDSRSVAEYLQAAEAAYQQRGYRKITHDAQRPTKLPAISRGAAKLYWLGQSEDFNLIGAFGADANLQSAAPAAQAETVLTLIKAAESGGIQWEIYRFASTQTDGQTAALPSSLAALTETDLSGIDPPGIPKPANLNRVLSFSAPGEGPGDLIAIYNSTEPPESLGGWYRQQMSAAGWQFNAPETASAQQAAEGTLCFSRGDQLCLVWIGKDEESKGTSVIISTRHLTN